MPNVNMLDDSWNDRPAFENVVKWKDPAFPITVRAWLSCNLKDGYLHFKPEDDATVLAQACARVEGKFWTRDTMTAAIQVAAQLQPRANAVEVLYDGNGSVFYPSWP